MKFQLPKLSYGYDSLEPFIDGQTVRFHHDKHHQTYLDKLNVAIEPYKEFEGMEIDMLLEDINVIPEKIRQAVINNGGGYANHNIYWTNMSPDGGGEPAGLIGSAINESFGDFEMFKKKFSEQAASLFGSGWTWLVFKEGKLDIINRPNQDSPLMDGYRPLLGLDLWEHAYYLKYQNKRADYIEQWWNVVNWEDVGKRYEGE